MTDEDEILTIREVAKLLRLSPQTIWKMVRERKLRPLLNRKMLYRFSKLEVLGKLKTSALSSAQPIRRIKPKSKRDEQIAKMKF